MDLKNLKLKNKIIVTLVILYLFTIMITCYIIPKFNGVIEERTDDKLNEPFIKTVTEKTQIAAEIMQNIIRLVNELDESINKFKF